jgi:glycosyltransferase involved in cell wall biosynthesis
MANAYTNMGRGSYKVRAIGCFCILSRFRALSSCLKISVIVPAFNEEKLIGASLASMRNAMAAFDEAGWQSELIVCDNNSTDRTAELARAAGAHVVFEPINQIGRARNSGAAVATGEWLLFIDADSHPSRELFADVVAAVRTGAFLYGGATIKMDRRHPVAQLMTGFWNCISRVKKYAAGSFILCDTAAFRKIGGFNLSLFAAEEIDLSVRLKVLARQSGKRGVILRKHPLVTSARKLELYSAREHAGFLIRTIFGWGRTLKDRDQCQPWYDGRR